MVVGCPIFLPYETVHFPRVGWRIASFWSRLAYDKPMRSVALMQAQPVAFIVTLPRGYGEP